MLALGILLSCAALLALGAFIQLLRRPEPPAWTASYWVGELVAVAVVASFAIGLACLVTGAAGIYHTGIGLLDLALLAAALAAVALTWRRLRAPSAAAGTTPPVAKGAPALHAVSVVAPEPSSSAPNRRSARRVA